ncbi:hypothetical protein [Schlesneria paludicola]|uniref:hypothetical protein n=1 Tax=Schlesneria paludicola TaxID=360056 RepID=UPI000299D97F|nr:hypothetical protein [Schlesneria paludicola]
MGKNKESGEIPLKNAVTHRRHSTPRRTNQIRLISERRVETNPIRVDLIVAAGVPNAGVPSAATGLGQRQTFSPIKAE